MRKSTVLISSDMLTAEFSRCCNQYKKLDVAVAWCGNPSQTLPYQLITGFKGQVIVTVGITFNHTHPDAIEWFINIGADLRIFKEENDLFHPKIYLFRNKNRYALFIGSSNFTYGGFYSNCECNCLIEGAIASKAGKDIHNLENLLNSWRNSKISFKPTKKWLAAYRRRYKVTAQKQRKQKMKTPPRAEEDIATASWLRHAEWSVYYRKVLSGLDRHDRNGQGYHDVLNSASKHLPIPWEIDYFEDIEKRRIIGGIGKYGWLGHVGASGQFRSLLVNGTSRQKTRIVDDINSIANLGLPIPWSELKSYLDSLISLGPTMKVWGRLLCIVRPDIYCTVAANTVRQNLSKTLSVPQNRFNTSEGYIQLIKLIHLSPWFNSAKPKNTAQAAIWNRRAAFLDAVFY